MTITKNLLRCLLVCVISVQISWTKPAVENPLASGGSQLANKDICLLKSKYNRFEPSEEDSSWKPSSQLLKYVIKIAQDLSLQYLERSNRIREQLLKDSEISTSQSPKILEFKEKLTQFEEKYSSCNDIEQLFELVALYSETTAYYFELEEDALDADDKLILGLLRKYGSEVLNDDSLEMVKDLVVRFEKKFEALKENLMKEDGKLAEILLKWFDNFKTLTNGEEKILAFEEFMLLYDEESFDLLLAEDKSL